MANIRIPKAVCAAIAEVINGSHKKLDALFLAAGAPGPPPDLAHDEKWKVWISKAGNDPSVDSLAFIGDLIEEFMDLPPVPTSGSHETVFAKRIGLNMDPVADWRQRRNRLERVLEEHGFQYFRGGRVLVKDDPRTRITKDSTSAVSTPEVRQPAEVEELIDLLACGLPRAMQPLEHRRKGALSLTFKSEYDIQDLLHSQLRPWIADIRPEEHTPSYAGTSTRMDFVLPKYKIVLETKRVRDAKHAREVGNELIVDIDHYQQSRDCERLWCIVYDPDRLLSNPAALTDLEGERSTPKGHVEVKVVVIH